jgi:hypothetical protein
MLCKTPSSLTLASVHLARASGRHAYIPTYLPARMRNEAYEARTGWIHSVDVIIRVYCICSVITVSVTFGVAKRSGSRTRTPEDIHSISPSILSFNLETVLLRNNFISLHNIQKMSFIERGRIFFVNNIRNFLFWFRILIQRKNLHQNQILFAVLIHKCLYKKYAKYFLCFRCTELSICCPDA